MHPPRLILIFIILLLALAGGLGAIEYGRITETFFSATASAEGRALHDRLHAVLSAPLSSQGLTARLLSHAFAGGHTPAGLETLLLSALRNERALGAATLFDASGVVALASRTPGGFIMYIRPGDDSVGSAFKSFGPDMQAAETSEATLPAIVEHGRRLADVLKRHEGRWPDWSVDRSLLDRQGLSLSCLVPVESPGAGPLFLAFSFSLEPILEEVLRDIPDSARILICSPEGHILNLGRDDARATPTRQENRPLPLFVPAGETSDATVSAAVAAWIRNGKPDSNAFVFQTDQTHWWAYLAPLVDVEGSARAGLAVSQDAMLGSLFRDHTLRAIIGIGLALALALLIALTVQSKLRAKVSPPSFFDTEGEIRELLAMGEGERLEFKSSLRFNLASGKFGKEIELAALKTLAAFMNTEGGTLAVGVDDQGRAVGLDADKFENDDHALRHFNALFTQHLGVEFLALVICAVRQLDGRKILLVECRKSPEPVILKGGKEEEFYVRAGPSSRRLTLSEFLRRMKQNSGGV